MDVDFDAAAARFSKENKKRQEIDKRKAQKEREEKRMQQLRAARWEAEAKERRDAEATRLAAEAAAKEADLERNKGVAHVQTLLPVLSTAAEAKGIRRRADKIALPRSWERTLIDTQQASKHGQLYFELNNPKTGRTTSASILDFSAAEGTVGLPIELLGNLGLTPETIQIPVDPYAVRPSVTVRYKQLKRGTFAKVQPVSAAFAADVGDVKSLLERELHFRTTLSVGDELKVSDEDGALGTFAPVQTYALRIIALEPEEAVSIIDTDLEVDVLPSVEAEEKEKAEADAAAARQAALDAQIKAQMKAAAAAERAAAEKAAAEVAAAEQQQQARQSRREAALARLPAEPAGGESVGTVRVQVRCPDGTRTARSFAQTADAWSLFDLVEASGWPNEGNDGYVLVASYPRRVFRRAEAEGKSLVDVGLSGKQEALFVELEQQEHEQSSSMDVS